MIALETIYNKDVEDAWMFKHNICKEAEYIKYNTSRGHFAKFKLSFEIYEGSAPIMFENLTKVQDDKKENKEFKELLDLFTKRIMVTILERFEQMFLDGCPIINLKIVLSDLIIDEYDSVEMSYLLATEILLNNLFKEDILVKVNKSIYKYPLHKIKSYTYQNTKARTLSNMNNFMSKDRNIYLKNPIVTISMENGSKIEIELFPQNAPNTVKHFISLINQGFYDELIFHEVSSYHIQTGRHTSCYKRKDIEYRINGEFAENGYPNDLELRRGFVSMVDSADTNLVGTEFFIAVGNPKHTKGRYSIFGNVIKGMEEVDRISNVTTTGYGRPIEKQIILSVTVETFGEIYEEPEKIIE